MFNFEQRVYILSAKFNHIMTVIFFWMSILKYKPCHLSPKNRYPNNESGHIRSTYFYMILGIQNFSCWIIR